MMFAMAENMRAQDAQRRASNYAKAAKRTLKKVEMLTQARPDQFSIGSKTQTWISFWAVI